MSIVIDIVCFELHNDLIVVVDIAIMNHKNITSSLLFLFILYVYDYNTL